MAKVTPQTIREFFERYNWEADYDGNTDTWLTGFRGDTSNFSVLVHLTENWLYFIISPFVNAPRQDFCTRRLYTHLLRLNHAMNLSKFSVDDEGDVVLTVELPTESLDYSEFADGLDALSYYADRHYLDALNLAQDPNYMPSETPSELGLLVKRAQEGTGPN